VKLQAVHPDRAVLLRAGILESLPLKDAVPALPEGSIVTGAVRREAPGFGIEHEGNEFRVNRDSMLQQMQRPDILTQALIVPNSGGGFLVREVQPGSVYEKLGVRVGDVIRSVNGQPINSMDDVMKVYQQLGGLHRAGNVNLEVARAGRIESLQYNLK
jgi:S1-C subfamily serine protease